MEIVTTFSGDDIVLDIRSPDEQEARPLKLEGVKVRLLPFYKLNNQFSELPQEKPYLLYCERGVMSRLQALYLHEQGFKNVKVYRP
uniref:tRNA sulfurtransferase n=1 Tax=Arsenophonus endosymbiont of Trialeurodes vaporariorum TaxID=235567 RepID=A0A3B0M0B8_9GAMM